MASGRSGQVHKIIRLVATSEDSWEDAARNAVAEASKTITDLGTARVVEADIALTGDTRRYRVKLEAAFQLDRSRLASDGESVVAVRRYLIVANRTLPSPQLAALIDERTATGPAEFHVLVPEGVRTPVAADPATGLDTHLVELAAADRLLALEEAEAKLDAFRTSYARLGAALTGEVGVGDPLTAARRVMGRATFDEIIVSTLPLGFSRWLKVDLPSRLERAFGLPVTHIVQEEGSD